ncbi:hypothetical protein OSB04_016941 [Centaurea solstitialis]|uniref:Uncharacterized protein n=1 Tax=Centaurea solstitialis TaxID=347529 RepID=A0AA38TCZ5_9ASTR|nr:hypothetical protein OSB04_016941 [Centaurea solstitialis]
MILAKCLIIALPSKCGIPKVASERGLPNEPSERGLSNVPSECLSEVAFRLLTVCATATTLYLWKTFEWTLSIFNPSYFSLWKSKMMLFMECIDSRYLTILRDGPLIPRVWNRFNKDKDECSSDEDRYSASGRYILKAKKKYTDKGWS